MVPVVGSQRSGTTLMAQVLGAHPCAVLIDEDDRLYEWTSVALGSGGQRRARRLLRRSLRSSRSNYRDPASRVGPTGRLARNVTHAVLKAPNLTYDFDAIAAHWPDAAVVYMYRDIRAVVASTLHVGRPVADIQLRMIRTSPRLASLFADDLDRVERLGPNPAPHQTMALIAKMKMSLGDEFRRRGLQVIDVRYEALVEQPRKEVTRVLTEARLGVADECFQHQDTLVGVGPGNTERSREIDGRSVEVWRSRLSEQEADEIWELVGEFMEGLGYRCS